MDELTFIKLAAKEIEATTNMRLKEIYTWCKTILKEQGSCGGNSEKQALHGATVACDLLMHVDIIENSGEYVVPHSVDTLLNEGDLTYLRYYYTFEPLTKQLTIEVLQCDTVTYHRLPVQSVKSEPLLLVLNSADVSEQKQTESGIILTA